MSKHLLTDAAVLGRRNLEHIRQVPEKLTNVTIQPLMFVLLFAYVFGGAIHVEGGTYQEFLMGGILIQTLAFAMMGPAQTVAQDFQQGAIDRFRSLPIARPAYLLGHYFAEMLGSILTIAILIGTGLIVGWRTHSGVLEVAEGVLLLLAFATAIVWPVAAAVSAGVVLTGVVVWSRLVLGRHVKADIVAGLLLGCAAGAGFLYTYAGR